MTKIEKTGENREGKGKELDYPGRDILWPWLVFLNQRAQP